MSATLRAAGLNETMNYAFTDPADPERLGMDLVEGELLVQLLNPMSSEQAVLRRTLLAGLLRSVSYNQRRGVDNVHLFELGTVYWTAEGRKQPKERAVVAGVLAGSWRPPQWNEPQVGLDYFDGKGVLESLVSDMGLERFKVRAARRAGSSRVGPPRCSLVAKSSAGWARFTQARSSASNAMGRLRRSNSISRHSSARRRTRGGSWSRLASPPLSWMSRSSCLKM